MPKNAIFLQAQIKKMKKLLTLFLFTLSLCGYAQAGKNDVLTYTTTYYSFKIEDVSDQNKLNECTEAVKQINSVTEAKVKYKPELKIAELIVVVTEKNKSSEGEEGFSPLDIKKTILRFGLNPAGFIIQNEQTK